MDDKRKTKAQLKGELEELRRRVAQMEHAEQPQTNHQPPFRAWAETAASAIFIFQDSVFRYTNPATSKITGYKAEELLGANIWKFVHPEHRELMEERLLAWQRGEPVPSRSEFKILTRSGQTRWINADSTFIEFDGSPAALTIAYDSTENKRAEEALKESEQRISNIIETAQEAIWMVDAQANTTYVNQQLAEMLGYTTEELVGRSVFDFVDKADRLEGGRYLERGRSGIKEQHDFRFRRRDGSELWTMVSTTPLFDVAGVFVGGLAMLIDITERRRAEEALRQSEAKFRVLAQTVPSAIIIFQDSKLVYANSHAESHSGYSQRELLSMDFWEMVHPDHRQMVKDRGLARLRGERVPSRYELKLITKSGEERWVDFAAASMKFEGKPAVLGTAFDITERKRIENALRETEKRFRTLAETASDAIVTIDESGRIAFVNQAVERVFGYSQREMLGAELTMLMPEYLRHLHRAGFARYKETGKRHISWEAIELPGLHKNGNEIPLELSFGEFTQGDKHFFTGIARDITDRKRAEEALHKIQEQLQHVLSCSPTTIYLRRIEDKRFTAEWVSEGVTRLTGYEQSEALSEGWWADHLHPDDREHVLAGMAHLLTDDRLLLEYRFEHKDGGYLWVHDESRLLRDESGKPVETIGSWIDVTERREAEGALRDSEERFRTLVGSMDDIVFTLDRHQRHTGVFGRWIERSGIEREVFIGKTASEIHGVEAAHIDEEAIARALKGEQVVYEWSMANDQGAFHFQTSLSPIRDQTGAVTGLVGVGRDVTARKQADEALRASEERYRDLVENARDIIYTHDLKGNYTSVNKAAERITGYTREEALALNFEQSVAPEYLETARKMIAAKLAGQKETVYDLEIIAKDGRRITVEVNTRLVLQDDVPIGIQGIARDVTARKRAEEALRESRSRLRAILDNCPSMIFLKDSDGRYLQVNRQFELTFKLTPQQVFRKTDAELFPPELAAAFRATDRSVLEAGHSLEFEESAVYADGLHTYIVHKFPLLDAAGNAYAVGGISTEITARKRAEDDLRKQKEIFQKIFDHIPVMIRFLDEDGRIKLVNREWERRLGWSLDEIESHNVDIFAELYPDPAYRQVVLNFIAASTGEFTNLKTRTRDGRVIDTSFANVRLEDGTNIGIGRDITEREQAADLLRRQTAQLAALHEIELEISAESELSRVLDVITRRASELLNAYHCSAYIRDPEQAALNLVASLDTEVIGLRLKEGEGLAGRVAVSGDAQAVDDYGAWEGRASTLEAKDFGPVLGAPLKWQQTVIGAICLGRRRGEERFTDDDIRFVEQIAGDAAIAIHQATLLEEVQQGHQRLQVLSHRLIDAQEAERKRLSRELHDQIGQALTAVQISLQSLQSSPGTSVPDDRLGETLNMIDDALEQVHDLSLDLRPSLLDDLGLVAALRWYVDRVASRAGLVRRFEADVLETRLAPQIETACFRIAQEALTNVLRHAHAATVWVQVTQRDSGLQLVVQDDGVGFDVRAALSQTGVNASLGLQGMQERAAALGGIVDIKSQPGKGVEVLVGFPLARLVPP
jgi:PAS domain S-box-containing protein